MNTSSNTNEFKCQYERLRIQLQAQFRLPIQRIYLSRSTLTVGIFSCSVSHCDFVKIMQTEFKWDLITNKQKGKNAKNDWRSAFVQLTDYTHSFIYSFTRFRFDWKRQIEELQIENENEFVRKVFREYKYFHCDIFGHWYFAYALIDFYCQIIKLLQLMGISSKRRQQEVWECQAQFGQQVPRHPFVFCCNLSPSQRACVTVCTLWVCLCLSLSMPKCIAKAGTAFRPLPVWPSRAQLYATRQPNKAANDDVSLLLGRW